MKKLTIFIVLAFVVVLCAAPVYANGIPALPHAFYGSVTINSTTAAPVGTRVEARGEGVLTGIADNPTITTVAGIYGTSNPFEHRLVVQGDIADGATLTFYVNGVSTGQTAEWHSEGITELNLTVTIPVGVGGGGGGGAPDTTSPFISEISVPNITETSADISWRTNERSNSQVEYWTSPSKLSPLDETMVYNHLVHLTDLTPGTTYHYKTMSKDAAGNLAVSDEDTFTTLGEAPVAAIFASSDLSVSPAEVNIGERVTISVLVTNTGSASGSYKVTLKINGAVEATKEVTLNAGASEKVTFTTSKDVAGSYSVDINGLSGSFTVKEKVAPAPAPPAPPPPAPPAKAAINWSVVGGIIAAVVIAGLLIFFVVVRRRA